MSAEDCLFCKIASKTVPSSILYEDEQCLAFEDIFPKAPVHVLVVPKAHIAGTQQVDPSREALVGHLVAVGSRIARERGLADKGYRLVFNTGEEAGQTIFHLHMHVLGGHALGNMG